MSSSRLLWLLLVLFLPGSGLLAQKLTEAEFRRLHSLLQTSSGDLWRTIPWKTSLLDAQRTAVRETKPIFIWAMDGHPLGCT